MERPYKVLVVTMWLINLKSAEYNYTVSIGENSQFAGFGDQTPTGQELYRYYRI